MKYSEKSVSGKHQNLPKPYKVRRYYTPQDISVHNCSNDCWVTLFNVVHDLTPFIQEHFDNPASHPIISMAGKDITHWFDSTTREPKTNIEPRTAELVYYCPQGRYLGIPEDGYVSTKIPEEMKWWFNKKYIIGSLTKKTRKIKIINMLTDHDDVIEVPCEETINEILDRYLEINEHAASYVWKRLGRPLDMEATLDENGIPDETDEFERLEIDEAQWYVPAIHIYFNDDLTVA